MKKFIVVFFIVGLMSCSNDFDFLAPMKEISIVYGILDVDAEDHFVRLERAFQSPDVSALEIAQTPDSLYYQNATVELIKENGDRHQLEMIDAEKLGLPRTEGDFADSPNYVYHISDEDIRLEGGEIINLEILLDDQSKITSETALLNEISFREPLQNFPVTILMDRSTRIRWTQDSEQNTQRLFGVFIHFNYFEQNVETMELDPKSFRFEVGELINPDRLQLDFDGIRFLTELAANIDSTAIVNRIVNNISIEIISVGEAFTEALRLQNANNGITSSQEIPTFSNINEGLGVFTSRRSVMADFTLSSLSQQEIKTSEITSHLNFL